MTKIYFAAPLFNEADRIYNEMIVTAIRTLTDLKADIYLPQENGDINDKEAYANSVDILRADLSYVDDSEYMIALIDGETIDAGVAAEIGYAYAKGIPVYGLYTDVRQQGVTNSKKVDALKEVGENQFSYKNLFVVGAIKDKGILFNNSDDLVDYIVDLVNKK